jgi:hypothetical protein
MRHLAQLPRVIAHCGDACQVGLVVGLGDARGAGHDPHQVTGIAGHDGLTVVFAEVADHVLGLDGPEKLHVPQRVARAGLDGADGAHGLDRLVMPALAVAEGGLDAAIRPDLVGLDRIVGVLFQEGRDAGDHVPVPHETLEIYLGDARHGRQPFLAASTGTQPQHQHHGAQQGHGALVAHDCGLSKR